MDGKFYISYASYYDCPTCQGTAAEDAETCNLSKVLFNISEVIAFVKENIGEHFLVLYKMNDYGVLSAISEFSMINGGHRSHGAKFFYEGHTYEVKEDGVTSTNTNFNILYGK